MKACVFTLGCKLNEVESASLMQALKERGYEVTDRLERADLYLINTCAVTAEAERKSRQAVTRVLRANPSAKVLVFGCASEHAPSSFAARKGVTFVGGAMRKDRIPELLEREGVFREEETAFSELPFPVRNKTRAFLRIEDGCNRFCSYCIIPYLRGRARSREMGSVVAEAAACGAKEIVLTGVDLSAYQSAEGGLGELLLRLSEVPARIRLGSLEVSAVSERFLDLAQKAGNLAPHFHLSLQSGSDAVLRKMNRKYTRKEYLEACKRVYSRFPDAAITTDLIAGFPTETEEDFLASLSMIEEAGFAHVHVFPYSPREGTAAAKLRDLPPEIKKERTERAIRRAAEAEEGYKRRFLGRTLTALFEEDGGYTGNYLRVFCPEAREGEMHTVRLLKIEGEGIRAEIAEREVPPTPAHA